MIEDKELRDLFRMECEEHLQCLDDGLLNLEHKPDDQALLEAIFRAAHSLKGAARMLDLGEIQTQAHALEDRLGAIKNGGLTVDRRLIDDLYQKLSAVRRLVREEVGLTGKTGDLMSQDHVDSIETEPPNYPATNENVEIAAKKNFPPIKQLPPPSADQTTSFHIGTLRVDPKRLDALLTHAGELAIANVHIARRMRELDELIDAAEEWQRALKTNDPSLQKESLTQPGMSRMRTMLTKLRAGLYEDSRRLDFVSEQIGNGIRTIRLLPFSTLFKLFPRLVHDLSQTQLKEVELVLEGAEVTADKRVLEELKDPIMHLLRNAVHHGIEEPEQRLAAGKPRRGKILLRASRSGDHIAVEVRDDGRGLDIAEIKRIALKQGLYSEEQLALMTSTQIQALIMMSGFTTAPFITEISGRGVGLDVVRANVEKLKGRAQLHSLPGQGVAFRLELPLTLATMRVQIIHAQGRNYALPLDAIRFSRRIKSDDIFTMAGRQTLLVDGQPVSIVKLVDLLELPSQKNAPAEVGYCTFLRVENETLGLIVDDLLDETEVMLKPQCRLLKRIRNVSSTTILANGDVCPVLNPSDLLQSLYKQYRQSGDLITDPDKATTKPSKKTLLLAEDSITTRTQEKRILESAGYEVVTAVDGLDAFNKFLAHRFDGVVSDVDMPNMNGLALAEAIRRHKQYADIPIILVTSLSSEADQRRGLEAGADAYLVKSAFDQKTLLDCLSRLI